MSIIQTLFYFCLRHTLVSSKTRNSYILPVNSNVEEEKQSPETCIVILLDTYMWPQTIGHTWAQAMVATTASLCCRVIWPWIFLKQGKKYSVRKNKSMLFTNHAFLHEGDNGNCWKLESSSSHLIHSMYLAKVCVSLGTKRM